MSRPFNTNLNPLIGYTEAAYNDESLYWRALEKNEIEFWDRKHAHRTPLPTKPSDFHLPSVIQSYTRYRTWNYQSGFKIHMNPSSSTKTQKEPPYMGASVNEGDIWTAFLPVTQKPDDIFLSAFMISNYSLKQSIVYKGPHQYRLNDKLVEAWLNIERPVAAIGEALRPLLDFPLPVQPPVLPSSHRYSEVYTTHDLAFESSRKARTAWKFLSAYTAFLLSFWRQRSGINKIDVLVSWLADSRGLNKTWLMVLVRFSQLADFEKVHRLGLFISYESPWIPFLPIFLDCNVPVTVYLGHGPDEADIRSESVWPFVGHFYEGSIPVHPSDCSCSECPEHIGIHSQRVAMCPQEFVDSRQREWEQYCADTGTSTQKRVGGVPVQSIGSYVTSLERWTMYEWFETDGVYQRCMVFPQATSSIFNFYEPLQRFFSPLYCEVDLCLDPPTPTAIDGNVAGALRPPDSETGIHGGLPDGVDSLDEEESPSAVVTSHKSPSSSPAHPWKDILHTRLGFDIRNTFTPAEHASEDEGKVKRGLQALGLQPNSWISGMTQADKSWLMFPIQLLAMREASLESLPVQFDLASRDLIDSLSRFQIQPIHQEHGTTTIRRFIIGIHGSDLITQWFVLVVEPHILLEIGRRGWKSVREIARSLARQGTEFHTARLYDRTKIAPVMNPTSRTGLGTLRADKESFTAEDYKSYERARDSFLKSNRGHLALKMGGFPARLARGSVDINAVYVRPFQDPKYGRVLGTCPDGHLVICDYATHADIDQLLGRYTKVVAGNQEMVTLWPPMSVWEVMGNNAECWSDAAEYWFQARLDQCRSGEAIELRSVGEWRKRCRLVKETRDVWKTYRRLAGDYLRVHLRPSSSPSA